MDGIMHGWEGKGMMHGCMIWMGKDTRRPLNGAGHLCVCVLYVCTYVRRIATGR